MDFNSLGNLSLWGGGITGWIIPFLFGLSIVVFFHELGHFMVARWCGVRVLVFSIGFGPELVGFNDRHGTRWKISAIPLGGYVKFFGDENSASVPDHAAAAAMTTEEKSVSFFHQPVAKRAAVVVAGPIANFILAIVIFAGFYMTHGNQTTTARVDEVVAGSAAAAAGLQKGDLVLAINGQPINSFSEMQRIVMVNAGRPLELRIDRGGAPITIVATPELKQSKDGFGNPTCGAVLGVSRSIKAEDIRTEVYDPVTAVWQGTLRTWSIVDQVFSYIGGLVEGRQCADQLGGPIRIAQISGQVATLGFLPIIELFGALSVSIGLLNLFPIPILDGGHLLFFAIEAARGRPLSERAQEVGARIGLALILMLMMFATFNDILHLRGS